MIFATQKQKVDSDRGKCAEQYWVTWGQHFFFSKYWKNWCEKIIIVKKSE